MSTLLPKVPWRNSPRPGLERRAFIDYILQPFFFFSYWYMSFTVVRLFWAAVFLPTYILFAFYRSIWPSLIQRGKSLLTQKGRDQLVREGKRASTDRQLQGERQFTGEFAFAEGGFERGWYDPSSDAHTKEFWPVNREYFTVCGLQACVVHERPEGPAKRTLVLLHGNPSYSFMYRHIISSLKDFDFEVLALDWIGFGGSDKPTKLEEISFELHMHTLLRLFETYKLSDVHILAHDWGGCVALSTLPHLPRQDACTGIMLLNSFFPPRPSDITWNAYLLYFLWLSAQGLLAGFIPEEAIIRYMAPSVTEPIAKGYALPFGSSQSKAAVTRFARLVPGAPQIVYDLFEGPLGRLIDGMCPPTSFSSLHEQVRLRSRDEAVRSFWRSGKASIRVGVTFGDRDTLLGDFYSVLCNEVKTTFGSPEHHTLAGAGHYAAEEKPEELAEVFAKFVGSSKQSDGIGR